MAYCCVPKCNSDVKRKVPGISFHEIPSDSEARAAWLKAIARKDWTPNTTSRYSVVCSRHFLPTDYKEGCKTRKLKRGATPSVFADYPEYMQPKPKKPRGDAAVRKRALATDNADTRPLKTVTATSLFVGADADSVRADGRSSSFSFPDLTEVPCFTVPAQVEVGAPTEPTSKHEATQLLRLHMIKNEAVASDEVLDAGRTGIFERESASSRRMLYMRVVEGEHGRTLACVTHAFRLLPLTCPRRSVAALTVEGGGVNATAVQADIGATNGVIHIIDRVLGMPSHTIYEKISSDPELKDTRRFAQHKGWIERLKNTDKRYTFFAPSDNAWHDIKLEFPSEYKQLSMDQFGYHAEKILERHLIVGREIPQMELENLKSIETARGKMDVRNVNGKIHLLWEGREAVVVRPDVQATNGVIHVISKVMMLRRDMTSAAAAPATPVAAVLLLGLAAGLVLRTPRA
ncbi:hypothetical protein HPB50_022505 [Hyalomma asiaticum]|uniref:Uncharacterized protein n=1 Tax=Hyalomma asiaticum TaxID=266040 RepID=A0ACB7S8R7_HYAAI|nr:hypothetical protein HPB50_022505 [Hyalomma asiaticum]